MPDPEGRLPEKLQAAREAFDAFLSRARAEVGAGFEDLCAKHPDLTEELRKLRSVSQLAQAAFSSRSFQEALREEFGDGAELTVELDEGSAPPADGESGANGPPSAAGTPGHGRRYSLENEVDRGGMGVIWRVRDRDLSRTLAMKVMAGAPGRSTVKDPTSRLHLARFIEEAQVTAQLDHPGIVPVHEVGFDLNGQPFFTMKLVKGRDLDEVCRLARADEERWNLPRVVGVLVKACQALAYAHSKGVIHRDLKPANVMVGRFGEVYVMDWGLAKITGRKDLHDLRPRDTQPTASLHSPRRDPAAHHHGRLGGRHAGLHAAGAGARSGRGGGPGLGHLLARRDPL
jgi:hypothetical protein